MGLIAGMIGAFSGFGVAVMTNATRKIPLSRGEPLPFCWRSACPFWSTSPLLTQLFFPVLKEPWNHVMFTVLGYWAGNYYVKTEKILTQSVNEIRADKGLPPMVGAGQWK